jgi:xyloglucan-specific exo-beta-1,4-glucanase
MKNTSSALRTILSRVPTVLLLSLIGIAAALVYSSSAPPDHALAQTTETYTWRNVAIGGGGGFVPGIVFNTTEQNLIYARTDIGGAYRWDQSSGRWIPLLDWVGFDDWNLTGVDSIATDPVDPNRLYIAAGTYTNEWTNQNGAILRSTDRGNSFQRTNLPFKVGGNMPGRSMGERLAIDPNRNSILYFGARSGNGLWRSTDFGATWARVTSFPVAGTYVEDPSNSYTGDITGVVWVTFDRRTGTPGNTTQTIYVGVADTGNSVYRSTNGGATWAAVPGQPTGFLPHHGILASNGMLYISYSDGAGPYDGEKGDVWRFDTSNGTWTMISPVPSSSSDDYFGYGGLTVDAQNPNIVMVAALNSWWPDTILFRSLNGGATWTRIWDWTSYPNRSFRYLQNITAAPWLTFNANPQLPEITPKLGWMVGDLEIDPFNSNRMMYGTGATIYGADDLTTWDTGGQIHISVKAVGLEETAVLDLISPPSGAPLLSGVGDICGFRHNSLTAPTTMMGSPTFVSTTSLDYAELSPGFIARVGNANAGTNRSGFSFDGGTSWFQGSTEPGGVTGGGTVAAAANASRVVWSPAGAQVNFSTNNGSSWTQSQGIPSGARVGSDRVNPMKFYGFANGTFYVSVNGGANFTAAATGLPSNSKFKAVPGREGDIWLAGADGGLWRSTNSGASFTRVTSVEEANTIGFGMAAPGQSYMALYSSAQVNGVRGIFRSTDAGATWVRINDDQHQYGSTDAAITGDPRVFGRVYISTNGRGIIYGEPSGTANPDFALSPNPSSLTINRGASGTSTITITRLNGFTSSVALSASGLPAGVTASFSPGSTTGGSSALTLTASSTATLGPATVTVTGAGGGLTRTATINLTVAQPQTPDFSLSPNPSSLTINRGASGTSTITITRTGGFTGSVAFSASGAPSGVTASFNPTSATGNSSVLTLTASSTATLGAATVTVTGTGGGLTRTTTINLTVNQPQTPDFSLTANPTSLTVNRGASGTSTVTVTRTGGFTGDVTLSASGLPSGVSASFGSNPATGTSSVLTLTASGTATLGAATVTVTGTGGGLTRTTSINLTVNDAGGGTGGVTVTPVINSNGPWFNEQAISLSNPTGVITSLSITIVVQRTTGVSFNGQYNTVGSQILQSNSSTATTITYQFNLAAGQTLGTGTNRLFAAQMSGSGTVHPTSGDTYTVTYTTGGVSFTQTGHF